MKPFDVAFHHATPHGVMSAIHIPDSPDPVPEEVLARLPAEEAAHARTLKGYRQPSFVGGRLALRRACEQLGHQVPPILPDARGTPVLPGTLSGSVSHKRDLAIGMVGSSCTARSGWISRDYGPARLGIADSVLRPEELSAIAPLPDARRWIAILVRFSLKESVYKALDPHVRRYVGFHEAFVEPDLQGGARIALHLANAEGPFTAEGRYDWLHGRLVTSVRLRRA